MPPDLVAHAARIAKSLRSRRFMNRAALRVDALIASFPKCGRTWLRFALANYLAEAFELEIVPDLHSMFGIIPNFDADPVRGLPAFRYNVARPSLPLVGVTHSPARITPTLPIVFIVRDPRDVVVSNYFHLTRHKGIFTGTITEFIDDSRQGLAKYIRYLNAWARFLSHPPHHVTSYELMSADAGAELRKILRFLAVPITEEALSLAVRRSTFESMQAHERAEGIPAHHYDRSDDESLRMRRGIAHGFRGYLTPGQVDQIEERCRRELSRAAQALVSKYSLKLKGDEGMCRHKTPLRMAG
jgi:sulfotransferase family protein